MSTIGGDVVVYNDYSSLMAAINRKVNSVIEKEVAPKLKEEIADKAKTNVYGAYSPTMYERRHTLDDPDNYKVKRDGDKTTVKFTKDHNTSIWSDVHRTSFIDWIERGYVPNYFNHEHYKWMEARPFVSEVANEENIREEISGALKQKGYHVK